MKNTRHTHGLFVFSLCAALSLAACSGQQHALGGIPQLSGTTSMAPAAPIPMTAAVLSALPRVTLANSGAQLFTAPRLGDGRHPLSSAGSGDLEVAGTFINPGGPYTGMYVQQTAYAPADFALSYPAGATGYEELLAPLSAPPGGSCLSATTGAVNTGSGAATYFVVFDNCGAAPANTIGGVVVAQPIDATFKSKYASTNAHGLPVYALELGTPDLHPSGTSTWYVLLHNNLTNGWEVVYQRVGIGTATYGYSVYYQVYQPGQCPGGLPVIAADGIQLFNPATGLAGLTSANTASSGTATSTITPGSIIGGARCFTADATGAATDAFTMVDPNSYWTAKSVASAAVGFMTQLSATKVSANVAAGSSAALMAAISGASDQAAAGSPGPLVADSLTFGTGSQALSYSLARGAQSVGRLVSRPAHLSPVEAFPADDKAVQHILQTFVRSSGTTHGRRLLSVLPPGPTVGATANIWISKGSLGSSKSSQLQVPSTLEYQSAHGNIWIDNSLLSGSTSSTSFQGAALTASVATIGNDFENAYSSVSKHFALPDYTSAAPALQTSYTACDSTGTPTGLGPAYVSEPADKRINTLVLNSANLGGGVGGYFTGFNYYAQAAVNCANGATSANPLYSNEAPFIFAGWFQSNGAQFELQEDLVRGIAHEYQHLVNFVNHSLLAANANSEEPFINEGLSMLAQDLAVPDMFPGVTHDATDALQHGAAYLANPGNFSVSGFIGIDSPSWGGTGAQQYNCGGGCYGSAFMFQRYLRDRFGGDAYTQGLETSGLVGFANLQANCAACNETGSQLIGDFAIAMETSSLGITSTDPRFVFGSLNLNATYTDQFGYPAITLQGVFATPLGSGASVAIPSLPGTAAFASLTGIPAGGENVSISDPLQSAGFVLTGGIAQH